MYNGMIFSCRIEGYKTGMPQSMKAVLLKMGWEEYNPDKHNPQDINLYFSKRMKLKDLGAVLNSHS